MAAIEAWASYVPATQAHKLPDVSAQPRAAAAWDEDSFTMAVAAGRRCLRGGGEIDLVISVRDPEPGEAGDVALLEALGLDPGTRLLSLSAGEDTAADALDLALTAVESDRHRSALVLAASSPGRERGSDGAAALLLGPGPGAQVLGRASVNVRRHWPRRDGAGVVPKRFERRELVEPAVREATEAALAEAGVSASECERDVPISGGDGTALLIGIAAICDRGGRALSLSEGERIAAFVLDAGSGSGEAPAAATTVPLDFAEFTLLLRRRGETQARQMVDPLDYLREAGALLRLEGWRCSVCDRVSAAWRTTTGRSVHGSCPECGGAVELVPLGRAGTVVASTRSEMEAEPTGYAVCDLDGGGRMLVELAAGGSVDVAIGDRVELVLRRGPSDSGAQMYLWKAVVDG